MKRGTAASAALVAAIVLSTLGLVETIVTAQVYQPIATTSQWQKLEKAVANSGRPLFVTAPWLSLLVRSNYPKLAERLVADSALRSEEAHYWLLRAHGTSDKDHPEQRALDQASWGTPLETLRFGGLELVAFQTRQNRWHNLAPSPAIPDSVELDNNSCRLLASRWDCPGQEISIGWTEVDYEAKRCWRLNLSEPTSLHLQLRAPEIGDNRQLALIGHIGFGDFNARLRHEIAAQVRLSSQVRETTFVASDSQGWQAFRSPALEAGESLELELLTNSATNSAIGDKHAAHYRPQLCLEFRWVAQEVPT